MNEDWDSPAPEFAILLVCTGNICRSPLAERLLQDGLDSTAPGRFRVSSAGTRGWEGELVTEQIRRIAEDRGVSIADFRSTGLSPRDIERADLVLTMERNHRSEVVRMVPEALRRTFTLREFVRILPEIPQEERAQPDQRWHSLVAIAPRYRRPAPDPTRADDVIDPFGGTNAVYDRMLKQMAPAIDSLIAWESRFAFRPDSAT